MKVYTFDDSKKNKNVGYRIVCNSGDVMVLDPLFLNANGNHFYHVNVASPGADFKLQTSIPAQRMQVFIKETNAKMFTSSHRFEVSDSTSFKTYLFKMDNWFINKKTDILYLGQPPVTNLSKEKDALIRIENIIMETHCKAKNYLFFNMYTAMGGIENVKNNKWDKDPIHLTGKAYEYIAPCFLNYLNFKI